MKEEAPLPEWIKRVDEKQSTFEAMSCIELLAYLDRHWNMLDEGDRAYPTFLLVNKGCHEGAPYLLRQLESVDPFYRGQALYGLAELGCREYRQVFIDFHLNDPDEDVRRKALSHLTTLFRNERDMEILRLALAAWDNPANSVALRLAAGAAMMYQLDIPHDERGAPEWWDEKEEDLQHPIILRAVEEARKILAQAT